MDALHVAAAQSAGCERIITFDRRQAAFARSVALAVWPEATAGSARPSRRSAAARTRGPA
ncbi:MAG: hypothetical protein ACREM2_12085 [Vulcanimicrobiaceae bacterium]